MCTAILTHGGNRTLSLLKERLGGGTLVARTLARFLLVEREGRVEIIVRFWQIEFKGFFFCLLRFWMQGGGGFSTAPPPSFLPDIPGRGGRQREYLKRVSSASSSSPVPFPYIPLGSLLPPTPPTTQYSLLPLLHHFTSKMAPFRSRMRRTDAALPRRTREGGSQPVYCGG